MRLKLICVLAAAVALASATAAYAAKPGAYTCSGGLIEGGTYNGLNITGPCFFDDSSGSIPTITVDGNLTVAPGASLNEDHATSLGNLTVTGNVTVGKGGILGLGNYSAFGAPVGIGNVPPPTGSAATNTIVDGNVIADQPETLYLSYVTIRGNLVSNGGGGPAGINFPLKNLTVGGNVDVQGWNGFWIGLFRSVVGGNVTFSKNTGFKTGEVDGEPDSSEIATNVISGNLICQGDSPAAQIGDSGGSPNTVGGQAIGQCSGLTTQS